MKHFHRRACAAAAAVLLSMALPAESPDARVDCVMPEPAVQWVQRALDGWELVRRDALRLDDGPLPWTVLYDAACVWHLAPDVLFLVGSAPVETTLTYDGRRVDVRAQAHAGTVLLPNRVEVAATVKASTALYRNGRATFVSMSLPSVWRADHHHARRALLDEYLQGVLVHELTHTRLLVAINRRLRDLIKEADLPGRLNDDVIQTEFRKVAGFERAYDRERDLFYQAAHEADPARRAATVQRALALVGERHGRYCVGSRRAYREIESLFLTLEGAGQWAAYRLTAARAKPGADAGALKLVRDDRKYWSQDEGLALFLLLDAMVPGWQARIFTADPASPFDLLAEAVARLK